MSLSPRAVLRSTPHYALLLVPVSSTWVVIAYVLINSFWWYVTLGVLASVVALILICRLALRHRPDTCPRCLRTRPALVERMEALQPADRDRLLRSHHKQRRIFVGLTAASLAFPVAGMLITDLGGIALNYDVYTGMVVASAGVCGFSVHLFRHAPYTHLCPLCRPSIIRLNRRRLTFSVREWIDRLPAGGVTTGAVRADGTPHRQPTRFRQWVCRRTGGHRRKFGAHPSGSCVRCGYWPAEGGYVPPGPYVTLWRNPDLPGSDQEKSHGT